MYTNTYHRRSMTYNEYRSNKRRINTHDAIITLVVVLGIFLLMMTYPHVIILDSALIFFAILWAKTSYSHKQNALAFFKDRDNIIQSRLEKTQMFRDLEIIFYGVVIILVLFTTPFTTPLYAIIIPVIIQAITSIYEECIIK